MPRRFRLTITIDDEIKADDLDQAWNKFKGRIEDHFYGPTKDNIEDLGDIIEEEIISWQG